MPLPSEQDVLGIVLQLSFVECTNAEYLESMGMDADVFESMMERTLAAIITTYYDDGTPMVEAVLFEYAKVFYSLGWKMRDQFGKTYSREGT